MRLFVLGGIGLVLFGCAGLAGSLRPGIPVAEIPAGEYEVRAFVALAPTRHPDGEAVAALLFTEPLGVPIEVWETPPRWLLERPLGKGTGKEHAALVKSPANYEIVALIGRDGRPIGYALLHRKGVHATLQDWGSKSVLFLSTLRFIDPGYIRGGSQRD